MVPPGNKIVPIGLLFLVTAYGPTPPEAVISILPVAFELQSTACGVRVPATGVAGWVMVMITSS